MGTQKTRGFTIIETMLFLAISGVLIVAMIAGTGASINIQRYRDAVETFKTTLQGQYAELTSVQNDRTNNWSCNSLAETEEVGSEIRGQSPCVLLGRYIAMTDSTLQLYSVVGRPAVTLSKTGTDIERLRADYVLNVSTVNPETKEMEWGTRIAWPQPQTGSRSLGLLIVRSPDSGQIYTFTSNTVPAEITPQTFLDMLVAGATVPGQGEQTICVDSNGLFVTSDFSLYINPYAAGPSAIETRSNDYIQSIGGTTRC